jgi:sucrose-6-phosphate hydrolase SacC (GH32 family)
MAGALTFKGVHHSFQGCPASGGWSHSSSTDLVHWKDEGRGVHILQENYEGMSSRDSPCSGFVTVDDAGIPCAGFRQCSSSNGTSGLNPAAHSWDVPMELRCAENDKLTNWSAPIWIYPVYFYRALPYDPVRPWKDYDGKWYSAWSTDGCNSTTRKIPCAAGGQLEILTSPSLHGAGMDWKQLEPMFTTNMTKSGMQTSVGAILREFVTAGYFGGLPGDPDGGTTRVVTQNEGGATYWVGKQANGSKFVPYWDNVGAVGHYDYGSLTMARTLGADPNQVAINGRRVLVGWIGGWTGASQSLARDLSLSSTYELLQAFVPELERLRVPASLTTTDFIGTDQTAEVGIPHAGGSMQLEVVATFEWTGATPPTKPFGVSFLNGTRTIMIDCAGKDPQAPKGCLVKGNGNFPNIFGGNSGSGPLMPLGQKSARVHTIVDHTIFETIVNNRTAMVAYSPMTKDPPGTAVQLVGVPAGVTGTISSWNLKAANNAGPQP